MACVLLLIVGALYKLGNMTWTIKPQSVLVAGILLRTPGCSVVIVIEQKPEWSSTVMTFSVLVRGEP